MSNLANPSELAQNELKEEIQNLEEELKKLRNLETQNPCKVLGLQNHSR